MKKARLAFLAGCALALTTACGGDESSDPTPDAGEADASADAGGDTTTSDSGEGEDAEGDAESDASTDSGSDTTETDGGSDTTGADTADATPDSGDDVTDADTMDDVSDASDAGSDADADAADTDMDADDGGLDPDALVYCDVGGDDYPTFDDAMADPTCTGINLPAGVVEAIDLTRDVYVFGNEAGTTLAPTESASALRVPSGVRAAVFEVTFEGELANGIRYVDGGGELRLGGAEFLPPTSIAPGLADASGLYVRWVGGRLFLSGVTFSGLLDLDAGGMSTSGAGLFVNVSGGADVEFYEVDVDEAYVLMGSSESSESYSVRGLFACADSTFAGEVLRVQNTEIEVHSGDGFSTLLGGLYRFDNCDATMENVVINGFSGYVESVGGTAQAYGGFVIAQNSTVTIDGLNVDVLSMDAGATSGTVQGGTIWAGASDITLTDSWIERSMISIEASETTGSVSARGGALYLSHTDADLQGVRLDRCGIGVFVDGDDQGFAAGGGIFVRDDRAETGGFTVNLNGFAATGTYAELETSANGTSSYVLGTIMRVETYNGTEAEPNIVNITNANIADVNPFAEGSGDGPVLIQGPVFSAAGPTTGAEFNIAHSTFLDEGEFEGPILYAYQMPVVMHGLVVQSTQETHCASEAGATFVSLGDNLFSNATDCPDDAAGDRSEDELGLGEFVELRSEYGMPHVPLLPGSIAIDTVPAAECVDAGGEPLTTDIRGEARDDGNCDSGAYEL